MKSILILIKITMMVLIMHRTGSDTLCIVCALVLSVASNYDGLQTKIERRKIYYLPKRSAKREK